MTEPRIYWEKYLQTFTERDARIKKARKMQKLGIIKDINSNKWQILPEPKYNKTTYTVTYDEAMKVYFCNGIMCLRNKKNGKFPCSHIMGVNLMLRQERDRMIEKGEAAIFWPSLEYKQRIC